MKLLKQIYSKFKRNRKIDFGKTEYTFNIIKENYFIYSLFEKLYENIRI